jgi:hypothetical protein
MHEEIPTSFAHSLFERHVGAIGGDDIHVTTLQGGITLRPSETGQYAIDAKSDFGSVRHFSSVIV